MKSKIPSAVQDQLISLTKSCNAKYRKYSQESKKMDDIVTPYIRRAIKTKNVQLIHDLLNLTSPTDKNGQYTSGEYIGRLYLYQALYEINPPKKKKK